jgi:ATP-dependent Clp protease adaptor protein ClpS
MKMYKVLIHNDDKNDMMHVARTLIEIFKIDSEKAAKIMLEAHSTGVGLCTVEPFEQAEFHMEQLRAKSLSSTIEAD